MVWTIAQGSDGPNIQVMIIDTYTSAGLEPLQIWCI